jgi:glycerol-3-phosphate dehydrogenase
MAFSATKRKEYISSLTNEELDLLVIGGGITGAGIALDAISRGLKVGLIEKSDFGSGTSSRSTKLIHGGLRYLKQLEFGIVREVGQERAILHNNAPHIVIPEKMLLPIIEGGSLGKKSTSLGLFVYDFLAGVKSDERRYMLSKSETLEQEPLLREDILKGGGVYIEYRSDDSRLVIEVMKTAVEKGAICLNYAPCKELLYENGKVVGAQFLDDISQQMHTIKAKQTINACGPWVDTIRKIDNSLKGKRLHLTKGVHIVVEKSKLPIKESVYFDITKDGRMMFAIPRGNIVYLGTTDTNYKEDIDFPFATKEDVVYILEATNFMFPSVSLTKEDVISSWAGLRPLIHEDGKSPSDLSRKDEIFISTSGLISIAGGKLTGFRKMAERSLNVACKNISKKTGRKFLKCHTKNIPLSGGAGINGVSGVEKLIQDLVIRFNTFNENQITDLVNKYGSNTEKILISAINKFHHTENSLLKAEVDYCINDEMTISLSDFFIRRTGRLYFERPYIEAIKDEVKAQFAAELEFPSDVNEKFNAEFEVEYKGVMNF